MEFRTDNIDPFDENDPIRLRYNEAIEVAQNSRMDNLQKRLRFYMLAQMAEYALNNHGSGDFAECGCFFGHSTYMIARMLVEREFKREFHVFDSFEGLSEFRDVDVSAFLETDEARRQARERFRSDLTHVQNILAPFDFTRLYPGWIPERFPDIEDREFAFVSIDVDLYEPYKDCLEFFYPRLIEGGVIYLDDYGYKDFSGARVAVDEYLSGRPSPRAFFRLPYGSAFLIK